TGELWRTWNLLYGSRETGRSGTKMQALTGQRNSELLSHRAPLERDSSGNPRFENICVFCGSSAGIRPSYMKGARDVGTALAQRKIGLIYGGGKVGLMGAVADAALDAAGKVIGVIPHSLVLKEIAHNHLTEMRIVDSMHERKAVMSDLADGFI